MNEFHKNEHRFYFVGYCGMDRISGISAIEQVINKYGAVIDFKMFSDLAISFYIEIKEKNIDGLYLELKEIIGLNDFDLLNSNEEIEDVILLNVTFTKGIGNMTIEVPVVPG